MDLALPKSLLKSALPKSVSSKYVRVLGFLGALAKFLQNSFADFVVLSIVLSLWGGFVWDCVLWFWDFRFGRVFADCS